MEFMELVRARRTVRAYADAPVPRALLEQLMAVAVQAPTGMNAQPWAFGVITNAAAINSLSDRTKTFLLANIERFPGFEPYRDMFADPAFNLCYGATAIIVVLGKPTGVTMQMDCAMAAYNIMLAARDLGLGSCWLGFLSILLNQPNEKRAFGIPDDYTVIAPLVIGYPRGDVPPVEKAAPEVLFWEK